MVTKWTVKIRYQCFSESILSSTGNEANATEEVNAFSHAGPPSFSPPPLPKNVLSNGLDTNDQNKDAFNDTNGYNSIENEEPTVVKQYNGDVTETAKLLSDMKNILSNNTVNDTTAK